MWLACPACRQRIEVPTLDVELSKALVSCSCGVAGRLVFEPVRSRMDAAVAKLIARLDAELENNRLKLPALPDVVLKVEQMARDENAGAPEIAQVIERDPVLAAKLLKLANSALYRGRVETRTVQQAIARLGLANLRDYVLAILSRELYVVDDPAIRRFIEQLWDHAVTVGVLARELAQRIGRGTLASAVADQAPDPDLAFVGGLLHDIGKAVLVQLTAKAVARFLAAGETHKVHAVLDQLHTRAGARVLEHWELPHPTILVAEHHHREVYPEACEALAPLIDTVALANRIAKRLGRDVKAEPEQAAPLGELPCTQRLGLSEVAIVDLEVEFEDRLQEMAAIL